MILPYFPDHSFAISPYMWTTKPRKLLSAIIENLGKFSIQATLIWRDVYMDMCVITITYMYMCVITYIYVYIHYFWETIVIPA